MIRKLKYILPVVILMASCKSQLDINKDPNNPTTLAVSKLLPAAEYNLGTSLAIGEGLGGFSQVLGVYMHQITVREDPDQYGATGSDFNIGLGWTGMYVSSINNLNIIIANATAAGNYKYAGIAEILKAYAFSQLVDTFGDVPYTDANKLVSGILNAKFDKGSDIYPQLLTLLDKGIADLNNASVNVLTPGTDDVIYGGDKTKWIKAANTIKLKLYLQERLVTNVSTQVNALLSTPANLIAQTSESFVLPYGPNGSTDDRNPGFNDYYAGQRTDYISPWFYEIMKGYNTTVNTGIIDPRTPYYFYNQLKQTAASGNPTEYRDSAFVSIYFGSLGQNQGQNQQNSMSIFGIYPVGGRYDDGKGGTATASSGTGAAPYRFITYADVLYMQAELINAGLVAGNARTMLQAAIQESFKQVDYVVTNFVKPSQTVPAIYNTAATSSMTKYINAVLTQYDTGNKLQYIMTQKWISSFGSSVDQYTDYRRTGFPILFDPKNTSMAPGGKVQPPVNGDPTIAGAQAPVPVTVGFTYPQTLPWFTTELETNSNAPAQKSNPATYKPFWKP